MPSEEIEGADASLYLTKRWRKTVKRYTKKAVLLLVLAGTTGLAMLLYAHVLNSWYGRRVHYDTPLPDKGHLWDYVKEPGGTATMRLKSDWRYQEAASSWWEQIRWLPFRTIEVVYIRGKINTSTVSIVPLLYALACHPCIQGVVLVVDSPGGFVSCTDHICRALWYLQAIKLVVGYTDNLCCSAGYRIVSTTQWVLAAPTAIVGSIGVRIDAKRVDQNMPAVHDSLQATYDEFVDEVAQNRKRVRPHLDLESFKQHLRNTEARVFSANKAIEYGLVDEIGTLDTAIDHVRGRVGSVDHLFYHKSKVGEV